MNSHTLAGPLQPGPFYTPCSLGATVSGIWLRKRETTVRYWSSSNVRTKMAPDAFPRPNLSCASPGL